MLLAERRPETVPPKRAYVIAAKRNSYLLMKRGGDRRAGRILKNGIVLQNAH